MTDNQTELATYLISLQKSNLILPRSAVVEIITYEPLQRIQETPDWFLGLLGWRGLQLPVVSFEMLSRAGASFSLMSVASACLVICTALGGKEDFPYFAFVAQAMPRLMALTPEELRESQEVAHKTEEMRILLNGEPVAIPNLDFIEGEIATVDYR